jgi:hypothetical protein
VSRVIIGLQRIGIAFFSFHVISIPGRRTGRMRSTVVSPFVVDGRRYLLSFGQLDWMLNARAAGWAWLGRGRKQTRVRLVEVTTPESAEIVREFPVQIPAGVQFFTRTGLVPEPGRPDQFAEAADRMILFRIDPIDDTL